MIAKGNQRGGGGQLAAHLMNALDNETVELAETRGSLATDIAGAFGEWRADSKVTRCEKYLYSLSVNPDQAQGRISKDEYFAFLEKAEQRLGLAGAAAHRGVSREARPERRGAAALPCRLEPHRHGGRPGHSDRP